VQGSDGCGNYSIAMTAPNLLTTCDGPAGRSIDWAAALVQHDRWLRTVVLARLGERQAVDEVIQEVSLAAVAQRTPLVDPSKVAAWLYRLAVRQSLLYRRQQGRQNKLTGRYARWAGGRPGARDEPDPLGWLLQDERRQRVLDALERLSGRDAEILLLKYTEGWSYRELADHLGLSTSAVEARLHRVRRRLREELADERGSEARP
jgi:RNA polymerase sigma-70 factor (ECF subfamily)